MENNLGPFLMVTTRGTEPISLAPSVQIRQCKSLQILDMHGIYWPIPCFQNAPDILSFQVFQAIHSSTCLPDASLKPATIGPRAKRAHSAESQGISFMKARSVVMEVISRENLIFNLPVLSCLDQSFAMSWYFMDHQPNPSLQHPSAICFPNAAPPATFPSEKLSQIRQLSLQLLKVLRGISSINSSPLCPLVHKFITIICLRITCIQCNILWKFNREFNLYHCIELYVSKKCDTVVGEARSKTI